jgi:Tfp pilus assembly protein PilF
VGEKLEEHCRRAVEFMRQGNYDLSVEEYCKALEIDPDYLPALNNLAIVYEKQPSWIPKAIDQWEKVLSLSQSRGDQKHTDRAQRHLSSLRRMQG